MANDYVLIDNGSDQHYRDFTIRVGAKEEHLIVTYRLDGGEPPIRRLADGIAARLHKEIELERQFVAGPREGK